MKLTTKPEFCPIAPVQYLSHCTGSHIHLCLAHLIDKNEKYARFYNIMHERGDTIIMDNGAFEMHMPYEPERLIELGKKINADVIVLPDYPFECGTKTVKAAKAFAPLFKDAGFKTMFVPQSKRGDLEDWISSYVWGAASTNDLVDMVGMSILGIPNAMPKIDCNYVRVLLSQQLVAGGIFNHDKHHHYLGLINLSLEVPSLINMGVLDSCDSSNPIWAAIQGYVYNTSGVSFLNIPKANLAPVDFDIAAKVELHERIDIERRIEENLKTTYSLFY